MTNHDPTRSDLPEAATSTLPLSGARPNCAMQLRSLCSQVHAVSYLSRCWRDTFIAEQPLLRATNCPMTRNQTRSGLRVPWNPVPGGQRDLMVATRALVGTEQAPGPFRAAR